MDLLRRIAVEQDAAIICLTHDEMILDRFDHIFRLRDGRLETEASVGGHLETPMANQEIGHLASQSTTPERRSL